MKFCKRISFSNYLDDVCGTWKGNLPRVSIQAEGHKDKEMLSRLITEQIEPFSWRAGSYGGCFGKHNMNQSLST